VEEGKWREKDLVLRKRERKKKIAHFDGPISLRGVRGKNACSPARKGRQHCFVNEFFVKRRGSHPSRLTFCWEEEKKSCAHIEGGGTLGKGGGGGKRGNLPSTSTPEPESNEFYHPGGERGLDSRE